MNSEQIERQYNTPAYRGKRALDFTPFSEALTGCSAAQRNKIQALAIDADIQKLRKLLSSGKLSAEELAVYYLERIQRLDVNILNAVLELTPGAIEEARQADQPRKNARILEGIPVLIKDNISTAGRLHTTAGAKALESWQSGQDAFIVQRLRQAGAIILGKANLSEWANYMTSNSANGFSVLGGQARNPHGRFDVGGSSSGAGVAVAAGLVPAAIGTETSGSIISPSSQNGVCGLKPSLGLVSRTGIIPITSRMDTAGPMAHSVSDLALLLEVLAGEDPLDAATSAITKMSTLAFTSFLDADRLDDLRIGVVNLEKSNPAEQAVLESAAAILQSLGAIILPVSIEPIPYRDAFHAVLRHGMKHDLNRFLQSAGDGIPLRSLAELIEFNQVDLANRAPFGQDLLEASQAQALSIPEEAELFEEIQHTARAVLRQADMLISLRASLSAWYSPAGWPALSLPGGLLPEGEPIGLTLVGEWGSDGQLIAVGDALETRLKNNPEQPHSLQI